MDLVIQLPERSRPFMGPLGYITPGIPILLQILIFNCCNKLTIPFTLSGGGFTQLHQDGHGTVDSCHTNLCGYNEVVMLRRLPEGHKRMACMQVTSLTGTKSKNKKDQASNMLYGMPHDDGRSDKPT